MLYDPEATLRNRIEVDLVEADVEIGFNLVDLAEQLSRSDHRSLVPRVLSDAGNVLDGIEARLSRLAAPDRSPFGPLIQELSREIEVAKSRNACPGV